MRDLTLMLLMVGALSVGRAQTFQFYDSPQSRQPATAASTSSASVSSTPSSNPRIGETTTGQVIFYAEYLDNRPTSLGEIYRKDQMTASHRSYPLGTLARVTRLDNNQSVVVRINDRGAYCDNCAIDVSWAAAHALDIIRLGRARVKVEVIGHSNTNPPAPASAQPSSYDAALTARGAAPATNGGYGNYYGNSQPTTTYGAPQTYNAPVSYESVASRPGTTTTTQQQTPQPSGNNQPSWTSRGLGMATPAASTTHNNNAAAARTTTPPPTTTAVTNTPPQPTMTAKSGAATTTPRGGAEVMLLANQTTGYCVQLGSYREYSNAHRHAMNMQNKGVQNVFLKQEQHASGGIMYKVVVAAFATSYDAQVHLQELRSQGVEGVVAQLR